MYKPLLLLPALTVAHQLMAKNGEPPQESSLNDPIVLTMIIVMLILLLAIVLLANVVVGAATYCYEKEKETALKSNAAKQAANAVVIGGMLLLSVPAFAQDSSTASGITKSISFGSLSPTAFYTMTGVLVVELIVIFALLFQLRIFLAKEKADIFSEEVKVRETKNRVSLWDKLNSFRPVEQEAQIDLGHDYDGIRELDNRLPPWWLYGFYLCIIFAVIYLWRYHVSHSAPLAREEFQIAMQEAEIQKENYLKKSANNVDENTVTLITDASALSSGKSVYIQSCAACHGQAGEGVVGPNLTDDYWIHGGSVQDVFKTIKYGWPEKGMKSWKDDLTPSQVAQVTSYILTLRGTNPPNAKEKQGELFEPATTVPALNKADSSDSEKKVAVVPHS